MYLYRGRVGVTEEWKRTLKLVLEVACSSGLGVLTYMRFM